MNSVRSTQHRWLAVACSGFILALSILPSAPALAADVLGLYVGGAIGQAQVDAGSLPNPSPLAGAPPTFGSFNENHSAYKVMVGVRPVSIVGAELAYIDFGHPGGIVGTIPTGVGIVSEIPVSADVNMKGPAAFGVLYLPVPVVDIYVKAGLARLQTTGTTTFTVPAPYAACVTTGGTHCQFSRNFDLTNTGLAGGAGVQVKFGSLAVRGEYERFSAAGGNPGLFSIGLTWTFL
jgi:opacity protein-like surface antigen